MTLVRTVEMRILVDAGDAQERLDALDAKARDLDGNAIKMRFRLDSAEGKAQLDDIRAKADKLGFKDINIKVRVDGAGRAVAELEAVRHEEDKARSGGIRGLLDKLVGGGGGGVPGQVPLPLAGGVPLAGLVAIVPAIEAALVEVTGLVSGFAAAGAGAGAFYLLAHPAISNLTGDVKALNAANQAQGIAQQKENLDPTKAHAAALAKANLQYQAVYAQMGQDAGGAAGGMMKLHAEYVKLSTAFAPDVFKVFNAGLKVANSLLPATLPFAKTFASALTGLLGQLGKFTQSKGFGDFLKQFHSIEGPALASIGTGIGHVVNAFGKLLTVMSGKDVAHSINIAFGAISGTINAVTFVVRRLMQNWDQMSGDAAKAFHSVASTVSADMAEVRSAIHTTAAVFDEIRHGAAAAVSGVISVLGSLPGKIKGFFAGAAGWLVSAGAAIVEGLIHGIESMIASAVSAIEHMGSAIINAAKSVLHIFSPSRVFYEIGQYTGQGLILGLHDMVPQVARAGGQLAAATAAGYAAAGRGGYGGGDHFTINVHSLQMSQDISKAVVQGIKEFKRHGGGSPLGIA